MGHLLGFDGLRILFSRDLIFTDDRSVGLEQRSLTVSRLSRLRRWISRSLALEILEARDVPATLFVDPTNGLNTNTGASIGQALADLQTAINAASAGDTISVLPGTQSAQGVAWPDNSDTISLYINKPLTIQGVTSTGVLINSAAAVQATIACQSQGINSRAIVAVDAANVTITGLKFTVGTADAANPVDGSGLLMFVLNNNFALADSSIDLNRTNMNTQGQAGTAVATVAFFDPDPTLNASNQIVASSIQQFTISDNILGGMVTLQNGAGFGAPSSSLVISNNTITKGLFGAIYLQGNLNDPSNNLSIYDTGLPSIVNNIINTSDLAGDSTTPAIGNATSLAAIFTQPLTAPTLSYVTSMLANNTIDDSVYVVTAGGAIRYQGNLNNPPPLSAFGLNIVPAIAYLSSGVEQFITSGQANSAPAQPGDTVIVNNPDFSSDTLTGDGLTIQFNEIPVAGYTLTLSSFTAPSQTVPYTQSVTSARGAAIASTTPINFIGNAAPNIIVGDSGNNTIEGAGGNDSLTGGLGFDTAVYSGAVTDYRISFNSTSGVIVITDLRPGSPDGTDSISSFEAISFTTGASVLSIVGTGATIASGLAENTSGVLILGNHALENVTINRAVVVAGALDASTGAPVAVGSFSISSGAGILPGTANALASVVNVASGALAQDGATLTATGGTLNLATGTYAETLTLSRDVKLASSAASLSAIVLSGAKLVTGGSGVASPLVTVQAGSRIGDGLSLASSGGNVTVVAGTYAEDISFAGNAVLATSGGQVTISGATATPLALTGASSLTVSGSVAVTTSLKSTPQVQVGGTSTLVLDGNQALTGSNLTVASGATLTATAGTTSTQPIALTGGTIAAAASGTVIFSGAVSLGATNTVLTAPAGSTLIVKGPVSTSGGSFTKVGAGTIIVDSEAPTPTLAAPAVLNGATNVSPIAFTLNFANASSGNPDSVTGLALTDLVVSGGVASNLVGSGVLYTFDVTPSGQGSVIVSLPAGQVQDAALFDNTASNTVIVAFDSIAPTAVTVTSPPTINVALQSTSTATIVVDYADSGTGINAATYAAGNIVVTNGVTSATVTGFSRNANRVTYTIAAPSGTWGASTQGTYTISSAINQVRDLAGNAVVAGTLATFVVDTVAPAPLSITPTNPTNANPVPVVITFSEPFSSSDTTKISVSGGTAGSFSVLPGSGTISFPVTPSGDGIVTINVLAGAVTDAASNVSTGQVFTFVSDRTAPTSAVVAPTVNASQAASNTTIVTVTYSDSLSGIDPASVSNANIAVNNGATVTGFSIVGSTVQYTVQSSGASWSASTQGNYTIGLGTSPVLDLAGNAVTALSGSFLVQTTAPTATFTFATSGTVTNSVETVTLTFSNPVTGLALSDIDISTSTGTFVLGNLLGSGTTYTFEATPQTQGSTDLKLVLPAASVMDVAGNGNTISALATQNFSLNRPVPTLSAANATNISPITITLTFGSVVDPASFVISPTSFLVLTNANYSPGSLTPASSASSFTFEVVPVLPGPVGVQLLAGGFADGIQTNIASATLNPIYDIADPFVVGGVVAANVNATQAAATTTIVTVTYGDSLSGIDVSTFGIDNIAVSNGATVTGFSANVNEVTYTITAPSASWGDSTQGTYTVSLGTLPVRDQAGNLVTSLSGSFVVDTVAPTASLALLPNPGAASNTPSFTATVTFSESVGSSLVLLPVATNATIGVVTPGAGNTFSFLVTPLNTGSVTIQIPSGAGVDAVGNPSTASNLVAFTADFVAPVGSLTVAPATVNAANVSSPVTFSVQYNDIGSGINATSLSIDGGILVTPPGGGPALIPTVSSIAGSLVTYSLVLGASPIQGTYSIALAGVVVDNAANPTATTTIGTFLADTVAPTASIVFNTGSTPTNISPLPLTLAFSEPVFQFGASALSITGATLVAGSFVPNIDGKTFTFSVTPSSDEATITVAIASGAAVDAGNNPSGAASASRVYDILPPVVGSAVSSLTVLNILTTQTSFTVTVPLDGGLAGIDQASLTGSLSVLLASNSTTAANAVFNSFSAGVATYTVTPITSSFLDGPLGTYNFVLTGVSDLAGNTLPTQTVGSIVADFIAPTGTITYAIASPTNLAPFGATVVFSTPVVGFDLTKLTLTGATASQLSQVDSVTYNFVVNPTGTGARVVSISTSIAQGAVSDVNGNPLVGTVPATISYDTVLPVPTVTYTGTGTHSSSTSLTFRVTFSEALPTGAFTSSGVTIGNGSLQSFTVVSAQQYDLVINPLVQGLVTARVAAGVTRDLAGNPNEASNIASVTYDTIVPVASIVLPTNAAGTISQSRFVVTINTSEPTQIANALRFVVSGVSVFSPLTAVIGSQTQYQATLTVINPANRGPIVVQALSGLFTDFAGSSTASVTATAIYQPLGSPDVLLAGASKGHLINGQNLITTKTAQGITFQTPVFPGYTGGLVLATGDVTGDGVYDTIVAPSANASANILVISGSTGGIFSSFIVFPGYQGGINLSVGDINGDGSNEIIAASNGFAPGTVGVFNGKGTRNFFNFYPYGSQYLGAVSVTAIDTNGDGKYEIATGTGAGVAPHVKVFNDRMQTLASFYAFGVNYTAGINLSAGDLNNDGRQELIVATNGGVQATVKVFNPLNPAQVRQTSVFPGFTGKIDIGVVNYRNNGQLAIIVGAGPGAQPAVSILNGLNFAIIDAYFAFEESFRGGVSVA